MRRPTAGSPRSSSTGDVDLAVVGALVSDPARCRILLALADGRQLPASRLAAHAGISAATASSHLGKLTAGGLLAAEAHGRYRYYRLAGPEVSELIEALERFAPPASVRSLRQSVRAQALRDARLCYDHLAGRLGVELMRAMVERGYLATGGDTAGSRRQIGGKVDYTIAPLGTAFLAELGVPVPPPRRPVRHHLDTSEHRPHLSGGLGRALLDRFGELGWVHRSAHGRAAHIAPAGHAGFERAFGIRL